MTSLKPIKGGVKWLREQLNALIDGINARAIVVPTGGGLDIQETPNGTLIALSSTHVLPKKTSAGTGGSGGGGGGGSPAPGIPAPPTGTAAWQSINVIDNSTGTCVIKSIQYWGTPPV